ncbi:MAG: hypothetical protein JWN11_2834 [Hyphomicrobiales bacterium]|nr:hypothetical protein [Hyphomicrobiales bacterium]
MSIVQKSGSEYNYQQRRELAHHVVNLFFAAERSGIGQAKNAEFSEIFLAMLDDLDLDVKVKLSDHLSRSENASLPLMRKMTRSEAEVAQAVLERSPLLSEDDLVEVSEQMTTAHRLAMSRRETGLTMRVTDSLIRFGEAPVLRSVTANQTAAISRNGFMRLAEHALSDDELLDKLSTRIDMPAGCALKILPRLTGEARAKLAALIADDGASLEALVGKAKSEEAGRKLAARQQKLEAKALAKAIADGTRKLEDVAIKLALEGRPHALAMIFAERSRLPEDKCADAIFEVNGELLAFLCHALDLTFAAYQACDEMRRDLLRLPSANKATLQASYAAIDASEARKTLHLVSVAINIH